MKDKTLKVLYHRGEQGQLYVFLYRAELHIATVEVDNLNNVNTYLGRNNTSRINLL